MKIPSVFIPIIALAAAPLLRADFLVQPDDVVAIGGDSITQQHQYSAFMEDYLLMCQPTAGQKIVNFGWSGEQAPGFLARLNSDVFPFKPTVMTLCYGMNDGHYAPMTDDTGNTYRKSTADIIEALKKGGVRAIVLGSAKCVDSYYFHRDHPDGATAESDMYNKTLGALADIDKDLAQKNNIPYADVFGITLDAMKRGKAKFGEKYVFGGGDGVHPDGDGHLIMAYAFLKALGCDGNIGTITIDMTTNKATGTPGQKIVSDEAGTVTVSSTRYPFCFNGDANNPDPNSTGAVTTYFPEFNNDLNRYMLVVKGITTPKAKVTWGNEPPKEYTAAELAKGINLAAEFLHNPFFDQFYHVHGAVQNQENQETTLYQNYLHNMTDLKANFAPGVDSAWDQIVEAAMKQHNTMYQQTAALVTPVTHTIKIEPEP